MKFVQKHYLLLCGLGIISLYLFTRIYNILSLPIFTDEALYVRWAQYLVSDLKFWDFSMADGKQPSFIWLASVIMRFVSEPLLATRLVSVFAGFLSVVGLFFLGQEIFKNRIVGIITSFIYSIYPFALVYDKLAIYDSLVVMFIIWALYLEILLVRRVSFKLAIVLGVVMGAGMLTKTSNNFALYLLPFSLLLFDFKSKKWKTNLRNWIIYACISVVIANIMYAVLRLSPYFYIISQKNTLFVYPVKEWLSHPFTFLLGNLKGLTSWLFSYMTIPFFILSISSFLVSKKYLGEKLLLLVWFAAPFTALALFGKVIYPRYILFMTAPLLLLGSYSIYNLVRSSKKLYIKALVIIVFLGTFIVNDFFILTDFQKAAIPEADKNQLLASWPSGVGVVETIKFLEDQSKNGKIYVGTQGTFGLMPYALEIYLKDNPNIKTQGYWPIKDLPPQEAIESAKKIPTYFVFYQPCPSCSNIGVAPVGWPVKKIMQFSKAERGSYYTLYQIIPQ